MSAITDARADLFDAISPVFVQPIAGYSFDGRVHRTRPVRLSAPAVYLDDSFGSRNLTRTGGGVYDVTFPIVVVYDGADQAQVDGLEELLGRLHDAALAAGALPTDHAPTTSPFRELVNGTATANTRAAVLNVDVTVRAHTFCNPSVIQEASV